jgi:hypothetical protein
MYVVLTDPDEQGDILLVSVSTIQDRTVDRTVVLKPGDHGHIRRDSYVDYAFTIKKPARTIDRIAQTRNAFDDQDMPPRLLTRIQDGVFESRHTPETHKFYLRNILGRGSWGIY